MWQYGIMAQTITLNPRFFNLSSDQMAQQFMMGASGALQALNNSMNNLPGDNPNPGEIVSHSVTLIGSTLLLTTIYRQQKP